MSGQQPAQQSVRNGPKVSFATLQQQATASSKNALQMMVSENKRKEQEEKDAAIAKAQKEALEAQQREQQLQQYGYTPSTPSDEGRNTRNQHAVYSAHRVDRSTISHNVEFQVFGSLDKVQAYNPLERDESGKLKWVESYTDDLKRTDSPASPWRKAFHERGPMQPFMKEGLAATSKAVHCGTKLLSVTNSYPFPVGLFMIGARVSRSPEDSLWVGKIEEILDAFYESQNGLEEKKKTSIAFVRAIPPNQTVSLDSDIVFHDQDCGDSLSTAAGGNNNDEDSKPTTANNWAKNWINVTKESIRSSIMMTEFLPEMISNGSGGAPSAISPFDVQSLIRADSPLSRFIFRHWNEIIKKATGEAPENVAVHHQQWSIQSYYFDRDESRSIEEKKKKSVLLKIHPILKVLVDTALIMIDEIFDTLPFARLSEHQFFLARLDADSFDSKDGSVTPASSIEAHLEVPIVCSFTATFEFWFEVVTVAQQKQRIQLQQQKQQEEQAQPQQLREQSKEILSAAKVVEDNTVSPAPGGSVRTNTTTSV